MHPDNYIPSYNTLRSMVKSLQAELNALRGQENKSSKKEAEYKALLDEIKRELGGDYKRLVHEIRTLKLRKEAKEKTSNLLRIAKDNEENAFRKQERFLLNKIAHLEERLAETNEKRGEDEYEQVNPYDRTKATVQCLALTTALGATAIRWFAAAAMVSSVLYCVVG